MKGSRMIRAAALLALALLFVTLGTVPLPAREASASGSAYDGMSAAEDPPEHIPNEVVVKFKDDVPVYIPQFGGRISSDHISNAIQKNLHRRMNAAVVAVDPYSDSQVLRLARSEDVEDVAGTYEKQAIVEYAEPNYVGRAAWSPDDPEYQYQWHLQQINVEDAWDLDSTSPTHGGDPSVVVAVIDTGVAYENRGPYRLAPDLANVNFVQGYDFINNDSHPNDDQAHGTHVCGTIAQSTDNGRGVAGVAFNTSIMPVKVLNSAGYGSYTAIANGIYYATDNGADIINMSLGGQYNSYTLRNACAYAYNHGVTVICAAGNSYQYGNPPSYPAAYDEYCIAVGAVRYDRHRSYYSNTGSYIDLVAPGGDVRVDQNGDGNPDGVYQQTINPYTRNPSDLGYWWFQGTSMAAPHVAGTAALIKAEHPTWTPDEIRQALQSTSLDLGSSGRDNVYGWGLIDAAAAIGKITAPALVYPESNEAISGNSITFQWEGYSLATRYRLEVNTDPNWGEATRHYYGETTAASQTVEEFPSDPTSGMTYYWRVWAGDGEGWCSDEDASANARQFTSLGTPQAATLVSPADGDIISGQTVELQWNPTPGATKYYLVVNTEPLWNAGIVKFSGDVGDVTMFEDQGYVDDGTTYYWRVWAGNAAGWCPPEEADSNARSFVNLGIPSAPELLSPGDGVVVSGDSIEFEWEDIPAAESYRLEVNSDPQWSEASRHYYGVANGTTCVVGGFPNDPSSGATYYWRVWAGNVMGWCSDQEANANSHTFVSQAAPDAPVLISPNDGEGIPGDRVTFRWSESVGASQYRLEVGTDPDWSGNGIRLRADVGSSTQYADTGYADDDTTYYWRVLAGNDAGWCEESDANANSRIFVDVDIPDAPALSSPAEGAIVNGETIDFHWDAVPTATAYRLEVNTGPAWGNETRHYLNEVEGTSCTVPGFPDDPEGATYNWRVWAGNAAGWCEDGAASANSRSFVNMGAPQAPQLNHPQDGGAITGTSALFDWDPSVGATRYRLVVNTDPEWHAGMVKFIGEVSNATQYEDNGYTNNGATYYWRVWAGNDAGWCSDTEAEANRRSLVDTARKYRLEVGTDPEWDGESQFYMGETHDDSMTVDGFPNDPEGTEYYWRVWGGNSEGWSDEASDRSFINRAQPAAPILGTPADRATLSGSTVTYRWNDPRGATMYRLEVNTDPGWGTGTMKFSGNVGNSTEYADAGYLNDGTTYYWRVWAGNPAGWSPEDGVEASSRTFINLDVPGAPALASPGNGDVISDTAITFRWQDLSAADYYRLEVNSSPAWSSTGRLFYGQVDGTSQTVDDLPVTPLGTTYYWRVWAGNALGWCTDAEADSNARIFTSMIPPEAPMLSSPAPGIVVSGQEVTYRWNAVTGATRYRLEVNSDLSWGARTARFKGGVGGATLFTDTGYTDDGTTYYWRVWAGNDAGWCSDGDANVNSQGFVNVDLPLAPTLQSPADGATTTGDSIRLSWNAAATATKYRLEVNSDSNWGTATRHFYGEVDATSETVSGLKGSGGAQSTYHWRVWSGNAAGWCSDAAATANSRRFNKVMLPEAPALASPADSAVVSGDTVTFQWDASPGADRYRLDVGTDPSWTAGTLKFSGDVGAATQFTDTGYTNDGTTYCWRVRAGNEAGWCSEDDADSRSRQFKNVGVPTAPVLVSPRDSEILQDEEVELRWNAAALATGYRLEVNTDPAWSEATREYYGEIAGLSKTMRGLEGSATGVVYYWRVWASNQAGWCPDIEADGNSRSFTIITIPDAPPLSSPSDDAELSTPDVVLGWDASEGATRYRVEVNTDSSWDPATRCHYEVTTDTSADISLPTGAGSARFFWRVWAGNDLNWCPDAEADSQSRSFVLVEPVPAPILVSPANGAIVSGDSATFRWNAVPFATTYRIEVNTDRNWGNATRLYYGQLDGTRRTVTGLANSPSQATTYYWRVWAGNSAGWCTDEQAASNSRSFVNLGLPATPALLEPADGEYVSGSIIEFHWEASPGATKYYLDIASDRGWQPDSVKISQDVGSATGYTDSGYLDDGTIYYWRVRAGNSAGWSPLAGANAAGRSFTKLIPPSAPALTSPADAAILSGSSISFDWNPAAGASEYRLEVNSDPGWGEGTRHYYGKVAGTSEAVSGFPNDPSRAVTYYWRVWAGNAAGWCPDADANANGRSFTNAGVPSAPGLVSPSDSAGVPGGTVTYTWNPSAWATRYMIEVNASPNWTADTVKCRFELGDVTEFTDGGYADDGTVYYWRVWAGNDADWCAAGQANANSHSFVDVGIPVAPALKTPESGSIVSGTSVVLHWEPSESTSHYRVEMNTDSAWGEATRHYYDETAGTSVTVTGLPADPTGTTYYWRVWSGNAAGWCPDAEADANGRSFINLGVPSAPSLVSPVDEAVLTSESVTYRWNPVAGATRYHLEVCSGPAWSEDSMKFSRDVGGATEYMDTAYRQDGTVYYWRVRAGNQAGWCSYAEANADSRSFEDLGIPAAPVLDYPAEDAVVTGPSITFRWSRSAMADSYKIEVNLGPERSESSRHYYAIVEDTSCTVEGFTNDVWGTEYSWRVWAGNVAGWCSDGEAESNSRIFTSLASPSAPTLAAPEDGDVLSAESITYRWNAVPGATTYYLEVSTDPSFKSASMKFSAEVGEGTQHTDAGYPNDGTVYFWRVFAGNDAGWSTNADTNANARSFTNGIPDAPELQAPADRSIVPGERITFHW